MPPDVADAVPSGKRAVDQFVVAAAAVLRHARPISPHGRLFDLALLRFEILEIAGQDHPRVDVEAVEKRLLALDAEVPVKRVIDLRNGIERDGNAVGRAVLHGGQHSLFAQFHAVTPLPNRLAPAVHAALNLRSRATITPLMRRHRMPPGTSARRREAIHGRSSNQQRTMRCTPKRTRGPLR